MFHCINLLAACDMINKYLPTVRIFLTPFNRCGWTHQVKFECPNVVLRFLIWDMTYANLLEIKTLSSYHKKHRVYLQSNMNGSEETRPQSSSSEVPAESVSDQYADGKAAKVWELYIGGKQARSQLYRKWFVNILRRHHVKTVLDVACGTGVDSVMLLEVRALSASKIETGFTMAIHNVLEPFYKKRNSRIQDRKKLHCTLLVKCVHLKRFDDCFLLIMVDYF